MKVVYNENNIGLKLSKEAFKLFCEISGTNPDNVSMNDIARDNPYLIAVIEWLGDDASEEGSHLVIFESEDDSYIIDIEYGLETVMTMSMEKWTRSTISPKALKNAKRKLDSLLHKNRFETFDEMEFEEIKTPLVIF